jgi:transcriptional regulator with XRE-family HTH domain
MNNSGSKDSLKEQWRAFVDTLLSNAERGVQLNPDERREQWKRFVRLAYLDYMVSVGGKGTNENFAKEYLGVDPSHTSRWMNGKVNPPTGELLKTVAHSLREMGVLAYLAAGESVHIPYDADIIRTVSSLFRVTDEQRAKVASAIQKLAELPPEIQGPLADWIIREAEKVERDTAGEIQMPFNFLAFQSASA